MNIDSLKTAKCKAQVAQTFLKEHGIKLGRSNALHLIARLEDLANWQALRASLNPQFEPLVADVTLLDGMETQWRFTNNITDRWGDLNDHAWDRKIEGHCLAENEALLEQLRAQMFDEMTFVAAKDGKLGILAEIEYVSRESESDHDDDAGRFPLYADAVRRIQRDHLPLVCEFPNVQFCVPDADEVCNGRPAIWAFFENGALTDAERIRLGTALRDRAY